MSESEFKSLVLIHKDRVFSYACYLSHSREEAEDITQEAFVRLWKNVERIDPSRRRSWLLRVTHNLCMDRARRHSFEKSTFRSLDAGMNSAYAFRAVDCDPASELNLTELRQQILHAMQKLPAHARSSIILREMQGLSYQEISDILDMPLNTIKVNIHRARRALRKHLAPFISAPSGEHT